MSMEIKQHLKLSQQLVMTPQLQQAIKLLQLSRVELVDMVRDELLENPVLEDSVEVSAEQAKPGSTDDRAPRRSARRKPSASAKPRRRWRRSLDDKVETPAEVKADARSDEAVADFDWDTYLETQSNAAPMPSFRAELGRNAVDRGDADARHVAVRPPGMAAQADSRLLQGRGSAWRMLIIGNLTPDGYLDVPLEEIAEEAGGRRGVRRTGAGASAEIRPAGRGGAQPARVPADPGAPRRRRRRHRRRHHRQAPAQPREAATTPPSPRISNQPLEEIYEATKVVMAFDPKPGRAYTDEESNYITPDVHIQKVGDKYFVVANDDGLAQAEDLRLLPGRAVKGPKAREYIQERLRSAQWLIRSIQQRQRTIVKRHGIDPASSSASSSTRASPT